MNTVQEFIEAGQAQVMAARAKRAADDEVHAKARQATEAAAWQRFTAALTEAFPASLAEAVIPEDKDGRMPPTGLTAFWFDVTGAGVATLVVLAIVAQNGDGYHVTPSNIEVPTVGVALRSGNRYRAVAALHGVSTPDWVPDTVSPGKPQTSNIGNLDVMCYYAAEQAAAYAKCQETAAEMQRLADEVHKETQRRWEEAEEKARREEAERARIAREHAAKPRYRVLNTLAAREEMLNALAGEGYRVVFAFPTAGGVTTILEKEN